MKHEATGSVEDLKPPPDNLAPGESLGACWYCAEPAIHKLDGYFGQPRFRVCDDHKPHPRCTGECCEERGF